MQSYHLALAYIAATLLTLSIFYMLRFLFIFKKPDRHLYFALCTLGGSFFVLCAILLPATTEPDTVLLLHKLRILALMLCVSAWFFCMYDIYFKGARLPKIFLAITIAAALTTPFDIFLSLPIREIRVTFCGLPILYRFATTGLSYSVYAALLLLFFIISTARVALGRNLTVGKAYGLWAFLPGVIGGD
ncbi:hypothetical protein ACFL43_07605 [Thermodesulfobacteriota bacterium]